MTRTQVVLLMLLMAEVAGAGALIVRRRNAPALPPLATIGINAIDLEEMGREHAAARFGGSEEARAMALAYFAQGAMADAEACYRVAAYRSRDPQLIYEWAFCLGQSGSASEAVARFKEAVKLGHPDPARCWYFIGHNELRQEHTDEARGAFRQAEPLPAAVYELAKLTIRGGNPQRAIEPLQRLAELFPDAYQPHYLLTRAYQLLGDSAKEAIHADRWSRLTGEFRTPFDDEHDRISIRRDAFAFSAGRVECFHLIKERRYEAAGAEIGRLMAAQPTADLADLRGEIELQDGRKDEAVKWQVRAVELDGPTMHSLWRLADALAEAGQQAEARRIWDLAIRTGRGQPDLENLCSQVAVHYDNAGDPEKHQYYKLLSLRAAGTSHVWRGEFGDAVEPLEAALERDAEDADTWYFLGEARRGSASTGRAVDAYNRCLAINPDHGRALRAMALLQH